MIERQYRSSPAARRIVFSIGIVLVSLFVIPIVTGTIQGNAETVEIAFVLGLIVLGIYVPVFWLALWRYPRLILTSDGVRMQQLGLRLEADWASIDGLRTQGRAALILKMPLTGKGADRLAAFGGMHMAGAPVYSDEDRRLIADHRLIPLDAFKYWIRHGDLAECIGHHVPILDADGYASAAGNESKRQRSRWRPADRNGQQLSAKRIIVIVAAVVLALALAVLHQVGPSEVAVAIDGLFHVLVAAGLGVYSLLNLIAAMRFYRKRNWFGALFWGASGVVLLLLVVFMAGSAVAAIG